MLRACGLSQAKVVAIRGVAEAALSGQVPTRAGFGGQRYGLDRASDLLARNWPVDGGNVPTGKFAAAGCPADDFGVRQGYRRLKGLEAAPGAAQLRRIGLALAAVSQRRRLVFVAGAAGVSG